MNKEEQDPLILLLQAKELGISDSEVTIKCVHCKAIFPNECGKCPQCKTYGK